MAVYGDEWYSLSWRPESAGPVAICAVAGADDVKSNADGIAAAVAVTHHKARVVQMLIRRTVETIGHPLPLGDAGSGAGTGLT
ncbi:hypothetical protein [Pseudonocardia spinosispora]|uniref:hypothetical protein n=1 Tax=Pseudonocardia spinosispora TaxID=103441 RepID=UPI0004289968|nr:hypothetical protein [Pseudonocardia spinosispora]